MADTSGQVNAIINSTVSGNQKAGATVNNLLKKATDQTPQTATGVMLPAYKGAVTSTPTDTYKPDSALEATNPVKFNPATGQYDIYQMPGTNYGLENGLPKTPITGQKLGLGAGPITGEAFNDIYSSKPAVFTQPDATSKFYMNGQLVDRDTYVNNQKNRLTGALKSNDQNLINNLWIDASKRGYTDELGTVNQTAPVSPDTTVKPPDFQSQAQSQVDADIAKQNAGLDLQIKQATENRDFETAQNLQAYKDAVQGLKRSAFLSDQATIQNAAARGLLGASGLSNSPFLADLLMRSNMGTQEQARKMYADQQATAGRNQLAFNQLMERINQSKQDLASGRAANIEKTKQQLMKDQATLDQAQTEQKNKEWEAFQSAVLESATANGQDITSILPFLATRDVQGLSQFLSANKLPMTPKAKTAQEQAQLDADIKRSDSEGIVYSGGKQVTGKDGKPIWTWKRILEEKNSDRQQAEADRRAKQDEIDNNLKERTLGVEQYNAATSRINATTGGSKSTPQQKLNLAQDAVKQLVVDTYSTPRFAFDQPVRTGSTISDKDAFGRILKSHVDNGDIDQQTAKDMYDAYGIPYPYWLGGGMSLKDVISHSR